jgi:phosphoserine phosphatase
MQPDSIIWDFDGTLLPNDPNDSEQSLMLFKLYESGAKTPVILRAMARIMIYADSKEHLHRMFQRFYVRFMAGTHITTLDQVSEHLAAKILPAERQAVKELKRRGFTMMVLSCGTADLSERVLKMAGLADCFDVIAGNRLMFENGCISGMTYDMKNPEDKRSFLQKMDISPEKTLAVGDGYTDIPMLDWAAEAIILDRSGRKKMQFRNKNYQFISSIPEVLKFI